MHGAPPAAHTRNTFAFHQATPGRGTPKDAAALPPAARGRPVTDENPQNPRFASKSTVYNSRNPVPILGDFGRVGSVLGSFCPYHAVCSGFRFLPSLGFMSGVILLIRFRPTRRSDSPPAPPPRIHPKCCSDPEIHLMGQPRWRSPDGGPAARTRTFAFSVCLDRNCFLSLRKLARFSFRDQRRAEAPRSGRMGVCLLAVPNPCASPSKSRDRPHWAPPELVPILV